MMNSLKKSFIIFLLIGLSCMGFVGCGSSDNPGTGEPTASEDLYSVVQLAKESVDAGKASVLEDLAIEDDTQKTETKETTKEASQKENATKSASGQPTASASAGQSSGSADTSTSENYGKGTPTPQQKNGGKASGQTAHSCTISVECGSVFDHMDELTAGKADIVPSDGVLLSDTTVTFSEGDTVFDVLKNTLRKEGILFEFETTPVYNGAYIEGIANLYEFDCGPLSGWMYAVNGSFPNYGCSSYKVKNGDSIDWIYTCDLGRDIGGENAGGQRER